MSIENRDNLLKAMKGGGYFQPINIFSQGGNGVGVDLSLWRLLSYPAVGAIPAAAAICNNALAGALPLAPRSGAQERILAAASVQMTNQGNNLQIEDRLAHMGGLNGTLLTAQTVGIDLEANLGVSNLLQRIGATDYSEVEWFAEWYTATGSTNATLTFACTFHDNTTGTCNTWNGGLTTLGTSVPSSRRYKIIPPNGKWIRSIQTGTLSVSTGTAGNFGVTARKLKSRVECLVANSIRTMDWAQMRSPLIHDNSCISYVLLPLNATSGAISGDILQAVN
jgi:hypothetical protein